MSKVTNMAFEEHRSPSAVPKSRARRLTARWYKDRGGKLVMRWIVETEPNERHLAALAA
jgi:hypothetical protein